MKKKKQEEKYVRRVNMIFYLYDYSILRILEVKLNFFFQIYEGKNIQNNPLLFQLIRPTQQIIHKRNSFLRAKKEK